MDKIKGPEVFNVLGQDFRVDMVDRDFRFTHGDCEHSGTIGEVELNRQRVAVIDHEAGVISHHQELDAYLHEALHAVLYLGGFVKAEDEEDHRFEALVRPLSTHLLAFMRDNPDVIAYLMQEVELP